MLTGERPGKTVIPPSKRVQVDIRIDEIVLRALEETPELRFATAAEFRTKVDAARIPLTSKTQWTVTRWAAAVAMLLAATVGASTLWQALDRNPAGPGSMDPEQVRKPQPSGNMDRAALLTEFKENFHRMLLLEREAALDAAGPMPADPAAAEERRQRAQSLRELQERDYRFREALDIPSSLTQP